MLGGGGGAFLDDDLELGAFNGESDSDYGAMPAMYLRLLRKAVSPPPIDCVLRRRKHIVRKRNWVAFRFYYVALPGGSHRGGGFPEYRAAPPSCS